MKKIILLAALLALPFQAGAQNMSASVERHELKFHKGTNGTIVKGKADYAQSYVYTLKADKGQVMKVDVTSPDNAVTFSASAPTAIMEGAFGVTQWQGILPEDGEYEFVLVMNDEKRKNVPFELKVTVRISADTHA